jgi:hypothetical protein
LESPGQNKSNPWTFLPTGRNYQVDLTDLEGPSASLLISQISAQLQRLSISADHPARSANTTGWQIPRSPMPGTDLSDFEIFHFFAFFKMPSFLGSNHVQTTRMGTDNCLVIQGSEIRNLGDSVKILPQFWVLSWNISERHSFCDLLRNNLFILILLHKP